MSESRPPDISREHAERILSRPKPSTIRTLPTVTLTDFLLARIAEDEEHAPLEGDEVEIVGGRFVQFRSRRLLECEAKRRIVEMFSPPYPSTYDRLGAGLGLRILASPYADHPDYREEWKP